MAHRSVLSFKDYEVHSVTTAHGPQHNANIATWVMQTALKGKGVAVALYKPSLTYELALASGMLNINLLAEDQKGLVGILGRKTGRMTDKFSRLPHAFDGRGCPYLTGAVGFVACEVLDTADALDHVLFSCAVLGQKVLNPGANVLTYRFLKENGYTR